MVATSHWALETDFFINRNATSHKNIFTKVPHTGIVKYGKES